MTSDRLKAIRDREKEIQTISGYSLTVAELRQDRIERGKDATDLLAALDEARELLKDMRESFTFGDARRELRENIDAVIGEE